MGLTVIILLITILLAGWTYYDAEINDVKKTGSGGILDMTASMWAIAVFLIPILSFPAYLFERGKHIERNSSQKDAQRSCFFGCAAMGLGFPLIILVLMFLMGYAG